MNILNRRMKITICFEYVEYCFVKFDFCRFPSSQLVSLIFYVLNFLCIFRMKRSLCRKVCEQITQLKSHNQIINQFNSNQSIQIESNESKEANAFELLLWPPDAKYDEYKKTHTNNIFN